MKPYDAVCPHLKRGEETTVFWQKVAKVLVPDDAAALMEQTGGKLVIIPNDKPGVSYIVSFKKFEERESKPDSKY